MTDRVPVEVAVQLGGLEVYSDERYQIPGKLFAFENCRYRKPPTAAKRYGYAGIGLGKLGGSITGTPKRIDYLNGERLLFASDGVYGYSEEPAQWVLRGRASDAFVDQKGIYYDQDQDIRSGTLAFNQGVWLYLWGDATFNAITTDDDGVVLVKETGGTVSPKFNDITARCFSMGNYIYVIRRQTTALEWSRIDVTTNTYTFSTPAAFGTAVTIGGQNLYDAVAVEGATNRFVVAWTDSADDIHVGLFDDASPPANVGGFTQPTITTTCDKFLTILAVSGEQIWVLWGSSTGGVVMAVVNITTGAVTANTAIQAGDQDTNRGTLVRVSSTQAIAVWEKAKETGSAPPSRYMPHIRWQRRNNSLSIQGTERVLYDCALLSRAWIDNSSIYVAVVFNEAEQGSGFVVQIGETSTPTQLDPRWCATFGRGLATAWLNVISTIDTSGTLAGIRNIVSNAVSPATSKIAVAGLAKQKIKFAGLKTLPDGRKVDTDILRFQRGLNRWMFDFDNKDRFFASSWGRGVFISGGRPSWYDGASVYEHGYAWFPSFNRDDTSDVNDDMTEIGGTLLTVGQVVHAQAIYESEDANAMVHRSAPSRDMVETINLANADLRFTVKTGLLTDRQPPASAWWSSGAAPVRQVYFRTIAGGTQAYFRADPGSGFSLTTNPTAVANNDIGSTQGIDALIQVRDILYTFGDILPNDGTPPCKWCCVHGDRLWLFGLENPKLAWFSQPYVETEAPRFNQTLQVTFPTDILCGISLDDKLVALSRDRVYIVTGDGPPASGDTNVGFDIQLVTTDVGIRDVRSLVLTPLGVMWRSDKGIVLLGRDLSLKFVGKEIFQVFDPEANPNYLVVGAQVIAAKSEVRFLINKNPSDSSLGAVIAWYNYEEDVWGIDSFPDGESATVKNPVSCAMFDGVFAIATTTNIFVETPGTYADAGNFFTSGIATRWIRLNEVLQGWSEIDEIQFLGDYNGAHNVLVAVAHDYSNDGAEVFPFTDAELSAQKASTGTRYQFSVTPATRQMRAVQVVVSDLNQSGPTAGMAISEIVFRGWKRKGLAQLAPAARH